uniref:Cysteine proteinase inhibitor n=1 Tax=Musa acuminata subsp. malaccensis TaxID=214687 RepID=A0A804J5K6_MUSAM
MSSEKHEKRIFRSELMILFFFFLLANSPFKTLNFSFFVWDKSFESLLSFGYEIESHEDRFYNGDDSSPRSHNSRLLALFLRLHHLRSRWRSSEGSGKWKGLLTAPRSSSSPALPSTNVTRKRLLSWSSWCAWSRRRSGWLQGALHQLTVEAVDAGKKKVDEAKVWVKPWLNFKELQEFRHAADSGLRIMVLGKVRRCCETTCCLRVGIYHMSSKYYDVCKTTSRHFFMYRR